MSPFRLDPEIVPHWEHTLELVVDSVGDPGVELESVVNRAREKLVFHGGCIAAVGAHNLTNINVGSESFWGGSSENLVVRVVVSVLVGMSNLEVACDTGHWVADMHNGDADVGVGDKIKLSIIQSSQWSTIQQTVPRVELEQSM